MFLTGVLALSAAIATPPHFVEQPCAGPELATVARCGTVEVLEDRSRSGGRTIRLNVIILPATSAVALPPLFDIEGGPGKASTNSAGFYVSDGLDYRKHRDVVLVDQRGTGQSNPLRCPELSAPERAYDPIYPPAAVERCRIALSKVADLRFYGTKEAVEDLDAVRAALGHERIDLVGISYGTTFALRYMATNPDRVRAAILIAPVPADGLPPRLHASAADHALYRLFAQCASDALCRAAFNPTAGLTRALDRLPGITGAPSREVFLEKLRQAMYQPVVARRVPLILDHAARGDLAPFYAVSKANGPSNLADGLYLSITCSESFALMDVGAARRVARATRFGDYRLRRQQDACRRWPTGKVAPNHLGAVRSSTATLVFSGTEDPVNSPDWATQVARELPNARLLIVPGGGHGLEGLPGLPECFDAIALRFFVDGDPSRVDASCLNSLSPPPFRLDADGKRP
jgi:pimeloyl-ACP methyl ester carboxylesterase